VVGWDEDARMTISFILNGEDVVTQVEADHRLIDILRTQFGLSGAKNGCLNGRCGACTVMFNGSISPACLIPAFRVRGSEIITIEGFSHTDEHADIAKGFEAAGVQNCGYCDAGKILTAETILAQKELPPRNEILAAFGNVRCRCTLGERLVNGVIAAAEIRARRRNAGNV
jgi:carbon-monoxide dehydrogenase small subunit